MPKKRQEKMSCYAQEEKRKSIFYAEAFELKETQLACLSNVLLDQSSTDYFEAWNMENKFSRDRRVEKNFKSLEVKSSEFCEGGNCWVFLRAVLVLNKKWQF